MKSFAYYALLLPVYILGFFAKDFFEWQGGAYWMQVVGFLVVATIGSLTIDAALTEKKSSPNKTGGMGDKDDCCSG